MCVCEGGGVEGGGRIKKINEMGELRCITTGQAIFMEGSKITILEVNLGQNILPNKCILLSTS